MDRSTHRDIVRILDSGRDLTLATLRADGWPQATTVSYVNDGLSIYIGCSARSQKAANMARDGRVSLTVTLPYDDWDQIQGVSLGGQAARVTDPDHMLAIGGLFLEKFPQVSQAFKADDEGELALFCVTPRVISLLDYRKGFGHTTLVTAEALEAMLAPA
ncbi:pyridoxamine 5'-phosphate oxidase family protein [uncultured Caulobacter sp.]|uniref:pyridoxamine 5'-phosphate oxidase family protein n=1 Tax=uncultured Caulobacter sp. TaxID=158749 RepID=UPI00261E7BB0|nr:pyridoxamine 5'-phosphate oxidase family protein [uncultured Caulobacter sp.]